MKPREFFAERIHLLVCHWDWFLSTHNDYAEQPVHILIIVPTRSNTKQSIYYSASSLYIFQVSTTPIIMSTQNCNYSLWYCATTSLQRGQAWPRWREVAAQKI